MVTVLSVLVFLATLLAIEGLRTVLREHRGAERVSVRRRVRYLETGFRAPQAEPEESVLRGGARRSLLQRLLDQLPGVEDLQLRTSWPSLISSDM